MNYWQHPSQIWITVRSCNLSNILNSVKSQTVAHLCQQHMSLIQLPWTETKSMQGATSDWFTKNSKQIRPGFAKFVSLQLSQQLLKMHVFKICGTLSSYTIGKKLVQLCELHMQQSAVKANGQLWRCSKLHWTLSWRT